MIYKLLTFDKKKKKKQNCRAYQASWLQDSSKTTYPKDNDQALQRKTNHQAETQPATSQEGTTRKNLPNKRT
jgi:hypothetical protein